MQINEMNSRQSISSIDVQRVGVPDPDIANRPLYKKDAFFSGSKQQLHRLSRVSLHSHPYIPSATIVEQNPKQSAASRAFADILAVMTDFSILKNKKMLLICLGNIFSMLGYYLPIMCLISFAVEDLHVDQSTASFLLTIFGSNDSFVHRQKVDHTRRTLSFGYSRLFQYNRSIHWRTHRHSLASRRPQDS
jgi:hypothetical protein